MTARERDPLGKRALFSDAAGERHAPPETALPTRKPGPLDVSVTCSSCDASATVTAPDAVLRHIPVLAWMPWRKHPLFMRCPSCNRMTWQSVSRPR